MDPRTFQKVRFVYPKNKESSELMYEHFDEIILPAEFGGKSDARYDYEEFSRLMAKDDLNSLSLWASDETAEASKATTPAS